MKKPKFLLSINGQTGMLMCLGLLIVTLFGATIRLYPALISSFPLFDGGLFYIMAQDLQASHLSLPLYTSYNGGQIPFVYPPLGLYLLVIVAGVFQAPLLTLMRLLPPLMSILTIPAFFFLSQTLLKHKGAAFIATCAFAVLPPAFDWLTLGGSITRTPGFLFALLALNQLALLYQCFYKRNLILAVVFSSLAVYSHPAMAWFVLYSSLVFFVLSKPNLKKFSLSLVVAGYVGLLTAPWWVTLVIRFGVQPLLNALHVGSGSFSGWTFFPPFLFLFTNEPLLDLLAVLGLLGLLVALRERKFLLVAWFFVVFIAQTKESAIMASIPFAMFIGLGIGNLVLPGLGGMSSNEVFSPNWQPSLPQGLFLVYVIVLGLTSAFTVAGSMKPIPQEDIKAMEWIQLNTPLKSRFAVLVGNASSSLAVSEWFPALSQRVSVNTGEGMEWLSVEPGKTDFDTFTRLQTCTLQSLSCVEEWSRQTGLAWDYLYIPLQTVTLADGSPSKLLTSLQSSPYYALIFQNASTLVFHRLEP